MYSELDKQWFFLGRREQYSWNTVSPCKSVDKLRKSNMHSIVPDITTNQVIKRGQKNGINNPEKLVELFILFLFVQY